MSYRELTALLSIKLDCRNCPVRRISPCGACSQSGLNTLRQTCFRHRHKMRTTIHHAGDYPKYVLTIVKGVVASVATMEDGRTQILSLHFQGDVIGRMEGRPILHELIAMTDVEICRQPFKSFSDVLENEPKYRDAIINNALNVIDQSRSWMLALGCKTARERVATFLYFLVSRGMAGPVKPDTPLTMTLPLTREEIGDFLGITIETVSRQFSALRKDSVIEGRGREITVLDVVRLKSEASDIGYNTICEAKSS